MKKVFRNYDECLHVYASQSQYEGRAGNVYFYGDIAYSYGSHFPMAKIIKPGKLALVTNRTYSPTTSSHMAALRAAIRHYEIILVDRPDFSERDNIKQACYDIDALFDKCKTARTKLPDYVSEINGLLKNYTRYLELTGMEFPEVRRDWQNYKRRVLRKIAGIQSRIDAMIERNRINDETREERRKIAYEKRMEQWRIENAKRYAWEQLTIEDKIAVWHECQNDYPLPWMEYQLLRINGDMIETSMRVAVSIPEARLLYIAWKHGKALGVKIAYYTVTESTPEGLKIGCHKIQAIEIEQIASILNWQH